MSTPDIKVPILFEDDSLLVIDKPAGMSVSDDGSFSLKDWVRQRFNYNQPAGGAEDEFEQRFGIVHRLDKETSGVMLIAKNKEVFDYLKGLFKFRRIRKEYEVLAYGHIDDKKFEISAPVTRDRHTGVSYTVDEEGRESTTGFEVVKYVDGATFLMAYPKTGRTHQIRVHLKAFGHPVVNDSKYANRRLLSSLEKTYDRMMLHARRITFTDWDGNKRVFESPYSLIVH